MLPVECVTALISNLQMEPVNSSGERLEMMCLDASRAHFFDDGRQRVYTALLQGHEEEWVLCVAIQDHVRHRAHRFCWQDTWELEVQDKGIVWECELDVVC